MKTRAHIRIFVATLMAVMPLFSCSKMNRVQVENEIVMSPLSTSLTKAQNLGHDKQFGVYAFYADCPGATDWNNPLAWAKSSDYFSDAVFKCSDGYWGGYPDPYYWPLSGSLMFAGYCPHQSVTEAITSVTFESNKVDTNPYLVINFTQNTTPSEMVDLLWFDVMDAGEGKTLGKTPDAVDIEFRHAMSQVKFQFVDTYDHYKLKSVSLTGSVNKGTFYSGETAGWLPDLTKLATYVLLNEQKNLNWTSEPLYIIPQYLDGIFPSLGTTLDSGEDVVLEFDVTDSEGFGSQVVRIPLKDYTYRWELGKLYIYTITVNSDPIEFEAPVFEVIEQMVTM